MLESVSEMSGSDTKALSAIVHSRAKEGMKVCEVGSWKGGSAETIGNIVKENNGMLCCVDNWKGNEGVPNHAEAQDRNVYMDFAQNIEKCGLSKSIVTVRADSVEAAKLFTDGYFDVVFIDAGHRYNCAKADIEAWMKKVRVGGILCGHDCEQYFSKLPSHFQIMMTDHLESDMLSVYHPGVILALYEIFNDEYILHFPSKVWSRELN